MKEGNGNNVSVTVRLYGPNTDYVINRERELQVIVLCSDFQMGLLLNSCYYVLSVWF